MNLPPTGSATDVSTQVLHSHLIYGASDNTNPRGLSSCKALNYAQGPSIQRPIVDRVTTVPYTLNYVDSVGLFGVENCFVRVDLELQDYGQGCYEEPKWDCAKITREDFTYDWYEQAEIFLDQDLQVVNTYEPANINMSILLNVATAVISVDLINNKTGNKYVDDWLDVRLYTKNRQEHSYDRLYCGLRDHFYVGFHARNTRELPYDVSIVLGTVITKNHLLEKDQRRFLPVGAQGNLSCANTDLYSY